MLGGNRPPSTSLSLSVTTNCVVSRGAAVSLQHGTLFHHRHPLLTEMQTWTQTSQKLSPSRLLSLTCIIQSRCDETGEGGKLPDPLVLVRIHTWINSTPLTPPPKNTRIPLPTLQQLPPPDTVAGVKLDLVAFLRTSRPQSLCHCEKNSA